MYDLALFALKLSISPFLVLISDFNPALLADWAVFAFKLNVEFNILAYAGIIPGVFAVFHDMSLMQQFGVFCI